MAAKGETYLLLPTQVERRNPRSKRVERISANTINRIIELN